MIKRIPGLGIAGLLIAGIAIFVFVRVANRFRPTAPAPIIMIPAPTESAVSFLAVGDIMLSRYVAARMERQRDPLLPFNQIAELLHSTDFNFGNLESPVSGKDKVKGKGLVFNTATEHFAGLASNNFRIVSLANNHALDQKLEGLENTRRLLSGNGIVYVGAGSDKHEAWRGRVITIAGVRIGFVGASYASVNDGGVARNDYLARIEELDYLKDSLAELKSQADFVVVTMHAGIEFKRNQHSSQIDFARAAIDYGADLVIGHHPHWIQTIEEYRGKYIFYSLGNFVFDADHEDTKQGLALKVVLRAKQKLSSNTNETPIVIAESVQLERIELIPIVIDEFSPRPATTEESQKILQKIGMSESVITLNRQNESL